MANLAIPEAILRTGIFLGVFALLALLETWLPRRERRLTRLRRWPGNIGIAVLNQLLARVLIPATAISIAAESAENGMGILNRIALPGWLEFALALLLLDLVIYTQHVAFHKVPWLWRIHRMHHTDTDFDTSTALRFHPVEILLSAFIKLWAVAIIGPSAMAVLVFEVLLNAAAMFNHSNLAIPVRLDRLLRFCIVTPDMHRVHHSVIREETDANYGFNFPWWDRFFHTYLDQPAQSHEDMQIGQPDFRNPREALPDRMLTQPFR
jgi:sterol desaturase/sphingolipid hydroxylase (fatty acid hydroxylase superfamily)